MKLSEAIEFLASIKRSEYSDMFEVLFVAARAIVHDGLQYEMNETIEIEEAKP